MPTATMNLNSHSAQDIKLAFLLRAVEGDGDITSLLAWADWLEEHGKLLRAAHVRNRAEHYMAEPGRTRDGKTWLRWHVEWELGIIANGLTSRAGFQRFGHRGGYHHDNSLIPDGSMEYALLAGYVPTLYRWSKRQARLGRIIEALGYRVYWTPSIKRP